MNLVKTILRRAFNRPKGVLGRLGGIMMAHRNHRMAEQAIELLDVQPSDSVLEIGFGPGVGIQRIAEATPAHWVAGIDPSQEMFEQAQARNAASIDAGRVTLRRGPVEGLSFESGLFEKALAVRSMQLWPDAIAGLCEIRRVLRPRGRIVLGFTRHCEQTSEDVRGWLIESGFADIRVVEARRDFFVIATKPDHGAAAAALG